MGAVHAFKHACGGQSNCAASERANELPRGKPADERNGERTISAPRGPAGAGNNARWRRYTGFGFAGAIDGAACIGCGSDGR